MKNKAEEQGNGQFRYFIKLMMNSSYGVFGSSICKREGVNLGIASFISANARIKMHKVIKIIKDLGGEVYNTDTDSVFTDLNLCNTDLVGKKID
jgi:DNA polymerase-2